MLSVCANIRAYSKFECQGPHAVFILAYHISLHLFSILTNQVLSEFTLDFLSLRMKLSGDGSVFFSTVLHMISSLFRAISTFLIWISFMHFFFLINLFYIPFFRPASTILHMISSLFRVASVCVCVCVCVCVPHSTMCTPWTLLGENTGASLTNKYTTHIHIMHNYVYPQGYVHMHAHIRA